MSDAQTPFDAVVGAYGARVGLRADDRQFLSELMVDLLPAVRTCEPARPTHAQLTVRRSACPGGGDARYAVSSTEEGQACGLSRVEALSLAVSRVDGLIARHAPQHVVVHAGAVRFGDAAVVFPGQSFSGKSSLAAALIRAGGALLSDDFAVLDDAGRVHPYRRAPSLRAEMAAGAPAWRWSESPAAIALLFHGQFLADATLAPSLGSRASGMQAMLVNTPCARDSPARAMQTLARALQRATVWHGTRGEADAAASGIVAALCSGRAS